MSFVFILWIPNLCFYGILVCFSVCVFASMFLVLFLWIFFFCSILICLYMFYFILLLFWMLICFIRIDRKCIDRVIGKKHRFFQFVFLLRPFYVWLEYDLLIRKSCGKLPTSVLSNQGQDAPADLSWPVSWPACANLLVQQTAHLSC